MPGKHKKDAPPLEPTDPHLAILRAVARVPAGCVASYQAVAEAAGLPGRARLVGSVLGRCPLSDDVPWHRIIGADGRIRDRRGGGATEQRRRLGLEGVEVDERGRIDLSVHAWRLRGR